MTELNSTGQQTNSSRTVPLSLALISLAYVVFTLPSFDASYVDFGDGNYMYISSRLADGLVLYRDITSPQPPLHLYVGSLLARAGELLGLDPPTPFRAFQILLRLGVGLIVAGITHRLFRNTFSTIAAFACYLLLPIGFWWTRGYQSEPLELVPMSLVFLLLLDRDREPASRMNAVWAGVCASLAIATNMTFAPYLCFHILYLVLARRSLLIPFLAPLAVILGGGVLLFSWYAGPAFIENVWSNQVGTFPQGPAVWMQRIIRDLNETLQTEGAYVLVACIGMWLYAIRSESRQRDYVLWYAISSLGSIVFTAKGGTRNYIFSLGEPMVAVFVGYSLAAMGQLHLAAISRERRIPLIVNLSERASSALKVLTQGIVIISAFIALTLSGLLFFLSTNSGAQYELSANRAYPVLQMIRQETEREAPIIAPPYYAFMTGRTVAEECAETYILAIRYTHEVKALLDEVHGDQSSALLQFQSELMLFDEMKKPEVREKYKAIDLFMSLNEGIRERRYGIILLNVSQRNLFGNLWILRSAIDEHYVQTPVIDILKEEKTLTLQCRNEELAAFLPKRAPANQ